MAYINYETTNENWQHTYRKKGKDPMSHKYFYFISNAKKRQ